MVSFREKIKCVSIVLVLCMTIEIRSEFISIDTTISCTEFDKKDEIKAILFHGEAKFNCSLYKDDQMLVLNPALNENIPQILELKLTVYNSTWEKKYSFTNFGRETTWNVSLLESDFFVKMTDYDLYAKPSTLHPDVNLKWLIKVEFCHSLLASCLNKNMVLNHKNTDIILNSRWGEHIELSQAEIENIQSTSKIVSRHQPCQTGSTIIIYSKPPDGIYFSISWNAPEFKSWFKFDCSFTKLTSCSNLVIYDAAFTSRKLLLISSEGILISRTINIPCIEETCRVYFDLVDLSYSVSELNWNNAAFSFSPVCAKLDYFMNKGDVILFNVENSQQDKLIFKTLEPFISWELISESKTGDGSKILSTTFDRQTGSVFALHNKDDQYQCQVSFLSTFNKSLKCPAFLFPTSFQENVPLHKLLLSNHYFYVALVSDIWLSSDGGNLFVKFKSFSENEYVAQLIGYEPSKSIAVLTTNNKIWSYRFGQESMIELVPLKALSHNVVLLFDHIGDLYAISSGEVIGFNEYVSSRNCRLELTTQPVLQKVQFLQLKSSISYTFNLYDNLASSFLSVTFGNPSLFKAKVKRSHFLRNEKVSIEIINQFMLQGISSVVVSSTSELCENVFQEFLVIVGCPQQKKLHFDYSSLLLKNEKLSIQDYVSDNFNATNNLLKELPVNYRPPSSIAVAIPQSSNIYNLDRELINNTRFLTYSFAEPYKIKQTCDSDSHECQCTSAQKFSSLEAHTDCRKRVYKVVCNHAYQLKLFIDNVNMTCDNETQVGDMGKYFVYVEELNGRDETVYEAGNGDDYEKFCSSFPNLLVCKAFLSQQNTEPKSPLLEYLTRGKSNTIYNASSLSIKFLGSGLFHFRITLVQGFTFCVLQDEFQAYTTNPPLPFPTTTIIRLTVSFLMGLVLIVIYMKFLSLQKPPEPKITAFQAQRESSANPQRRNMSYVSENDIKALRSKLRSSFAA